MGTFVLAAALTFATPLLRATTIISTITGTVPAGALGIVGSGNGYTADALEFTSPGAYLFTDALIDLYVSLAGHDGNYLAFLYANAAASGRDIPGAELAELAAGTAPATKFAPPLTFSLTKLQPAADALPILLSANTKYWLVIAPADSNGYFAIAMGGATSPSPIAQEYPPETSTWRNNGAFANEQYEIDGATPSDAPEPGGGMLFLTAAGALAALRLWHRPPRIRSSLMRRLPISGSTAARRTGRIAGTVAVAAFSLILPGQMRAQTLNLSVGTLGAGTKNNEFLLEFGLNGSGLETPYPAFATNAAAGGPPTSTVTGTQRTSYQQSANPSFTFDFSFSVAALCTLSLNPTYQAFIGSTTSSIKLLQGTTALATGVQAATETFVGNPGAIYSIPSAVLQPNTQYDLIVTTLGVPASSYPGFSGTVGWGQISLDVNAPTLPSAVTAFSPAQGASGVATTPTLTWTAAALASSYDIYLGTSPMPPLVASIAGTSYSPAALIPNTTYYWYLVSKNLAGSATSATWSFTTGASQNSPAIKSGGVVSASAFGQLPAVAPGSWIEIYGSNLAADSRSWAASDFSGVIAPTTLDGTKMTIGGQAAFIDYISPGQINAQVPSNVASGSQPIIVTTANGPSAPYTVTVNPAEPGLLAPASFNIGGTQYAAALFGDGATYVLPPGAIAGVASRRAQPGDTITLYGIGFGPVVPNTPAGQIVQQSNTLAASLQVTFATTLASVTYDGLAPSAIGLYQFNVVVPSVSSSDSVPLTFTLGGAAGTQKLYIAVQNGN